MSAAGPAACPSKTQALQPSSPRFPSRTWGVFLLPALP